MIKRIALAVLSTFTLTTVFTNALALDKFSANNLVISSDKDQESIAVTIYSNNLALIKDQRKVKLTDRNQSLVFRDVSAQIRPETALIKNLTHSGGLLIEQQHFDFDLLTPEKLLEKNVGKTVLLIRTNPVTGQEKSEQAVVLSASNGAVLKVGNKIETGLLPPFSRIVYDEIPANLYDRPTLTAEIINKIPAEKAAHTIELSYLTGGLTWKADYVAELNAKEDSLNLSAWATLTNTSGASYSNAQLQLVAGDVNRVQENSPRNMTMRKNNDMMAEASAPVSEESLLEYHLYTLATPITIIENQTKQVALLSNTTIPVRKELVLRGADYYYQGQYGDLGKQLKIGVFVEFDNKESAKLGLPLPKGIVRVYKKDKAGQTQFVGEDNIDHTAKNERVRLKLGEAFDITADKKQTDFKTLPASTKGTNTFESAYEIMLKNAKKEKVLVTVQEPISGDWKIIEENKNHTKINSQLATWKVEVPAESSATLNYRVIVKY